MNRVPLLVLLAIAVGVLSATTGSESTAVASDCRRTSVDLKPLTELGTARYLGYLGGLYPNGLNTPPAEHLNLALARARAVRPLAPDGSPMLDGKIVLLSVGMSSTTMEYQVFQGMAQTDPQVNPDVLVVDGAQGGQDAAIVANPASGYWTEVDRRLQTAGATREQVQVIWLKEAHTRPSGPFPEHAEALRDDLEAIVHVAHDRFPNLKLLYFSSRIYAGYATSRLNPEPYAYESAFAVRWVIEKQISGDPTLNADPTKGQVHAPVLLWGPYLWADGMTERQDGLTWECSDLADDGTHPSASGRQKVADMLMAFFKIDDTARRWFMADPNATPLPPPTPAPTATRTPTNTPQPPGEMRSYRVQETPSGDEMWISTSSRNQQRRIERISPQRSMWVCGLVIADLDAEWGFRFRESRLSIVQSAPQQSRSTIRKISADPPRGDDALRCIHVGAVIQTVDGTPPPAPTATPTRTGPSKTIYLPMLAQR